MPNFTIEGRMKQIPDILRNFSWELSFPNINEILPNTVPNDEGLIVRAKTTSMPGRTVEVIESNHFGIKQFFPGRVSFAGTLEVTYEETDDLFVTKALNEWNNKIFEVDPAAENAGSSDAVSKRQGLSTDAYLKLYRYNNDLLDRKIRIYNVWPQTVADVPMDYNGNESVKYSVTFQYDFWRAVE
jgi:hypothetical protein